MKYIILIHSNEHSLKLWETLTEQQQMDFGRGHLKLTEEMAEAGELVVSEGLADPALARWVSVRDGETIVSDGPFAEVKEHLAGFYLVECESLERAIEWAAKVPDAADPRGRGAADPRHERMGDLNPRAIEDLLRECAPQVLGAVVRRYGDFDTCEDAVQEALLAAAQQWPADGRPGATRGTG